MPIARRAVLAGPLALFAQKRERPKARIAITLDLEMSRNFPGWTDTHWDYDKGSLDDASKRYSVNAADRVRQNGGHIHFFAVGRVFEQEDVSWLKHIVFSGHPVGNHSYDHIYLLARSPAELQFRFQRAPWLMEGKPVAQVIEQNIRMTSEAMKTRLGVGPVRFRTPGGFRDGLGGRADLQRMLQSLGFTWVSARYRAHAMGSPDDRVFTDIVSAVRRSQPFRYPETGLLEIPMTPISDITAFRTGRWPLESFLTAIRKGVEDTIEDGGVFDFLGHPSCLLNTDPEMRVFHLICDLVKQAGDRAEVTTLDRIAKGMESAQ
jgi:peptidoglycan/xylan/chitin deacetylase (PgdA/CDA1 family)